MKLRCPKCNSEHEADLSRPHATFLCAACQTLTEAEREERRVWIRTKHAKTLAERKRKRKVWNEVLRQYEPQKERPF